MIRKSTKVMALLLGATVAVGSVSTAVSAKTVTPAPAVKSAAASSDSAPVKDETVYVFTGADGAVRKVLVNDWLQNTGSAAALDDVSRLSDIENVKGDETFTTGADGALVWDAKGEDIYYQGTTDQSVPLEMTVRYTLDGKPISPEDLAGKSGKVTIRFDYKNTQFEEVKVNGKKTKIYVPFVAMTGMMLDTEVFRNVTVTNGKMENLGNTTVVIGIAMPGMQENLDINPKDLEIPNYVEITADAENFKLGSTITVASASILDGLNSEDFSFEDLSKSVDQLSDGMNKLMDGSGKLYDGLCTLLEQSNALVAGIDQLSDGATKLQSGADALSSGASQLYSGASQLSQGLDTLNANSEALNGGAAQVFNTLLSTANSQLAAAGLSVPTLTIGNYADVLNGVIASLDENAVYQSALQQVTDGVNARRGEIEAKVTEVVRGQVLSQVTAAVTEAVRENVSQQVHANETAFRTAVVQQALGMTLEEYEAAVQAGLVPQDKQDMIDAAVASAMDAEIEKQMESEQVKALLQQKIQQTTDEKMASEEILATIAQNTQLQVEKAISDMMASEEIQSKLQAAAEGAKAVIGLKTSLDSYNGFYLGVLAYTDGVSSATAGAHELMAGTDTLRSGMDALDSGVGELSGGIATMQEKAPMLINGITQLRDGSKQLDEGLEKMMKEGIQKLVDLADQDLENLTGRVCACIDVAKNYTSFSGIHAGTEGRVKFLLRTDAIDAAE